MLQVATSSVLHIVYRYRGYVNIGKQLVVSLEVEAEAEAGEEQE